MLRMATFKKTFSLTWSRREIKLPFFHGGFLEAFRFAFENKGDRLFGFAANQLFGTDRFG